MGKVIVWNLMSLDGYFEGAKKWDLDFHMQAWGPELEALSKEFGKRPKRWSSAGVTYEGMKAYWTTTEDETESQDLYERAAEDRGFAHSGKVGMEQHAASSSDIAGELKQLKQATEKNIYIFGSAELVASLLPAERDRRDHDLRRADPARQGNAAFKPAGPAKLHRSCWIPADWRQAGLSCGMRRRERRPSRAGC